MATKLSWNFERLRAAMGHPDYKVLQRFVRLAMKRDLGSTLKWADFIVMNPALEKPPGSSRSSLNDAMRTQVRKWDEVEP